MTKYLTPQEEYDVKARRLSGTHAEKLEQIDAAIQELLDIKMLECSAARPGVRFLAVPRPRGHALAMTVTILVLLIMLVLLVGVRPSHAQTADPEPAAPLLAPASLRLCSDSRVFPAHGGRVLDHQTTAPIAIVWWIGNKSGSW